jgi:hypothetical protein
MARSRKILLAGAVGVSALALIGTGAGATFTDSVDATQTITIGAMRLQVTSPTGIVSADGRTVTMPAVGPVGSIFETKNSVITIKNVGDLPVKPMSFQMRETHAENDASRALVNQVNVCIKASDMYGGTFIQGNGPLMNGVKQATNATRFLSPLPVGASMTYSVDFYAGLDSYSTLGAGQVVTPHIGNGVGGIRCGKVASDDAVQGELWSGGVGSVYKTPDSLTNAAVGGVITPSLTFTLSD